MLCRDFCDVTGFSLSRDLLRFCLIYVTVCWSWVQSNNNNKLFFFFLILFCYLVLRFVLINFVLHFNDKLLSIRPLMSKLLSLAVINNNREFKELFRGLKALYSLKKKTTKKQQQHTNTHIQINEI